MERRRGIGEIPIDHAAAAGGQIDAAMDAGVAGDVVLIAEVVQVVVDADPGGSGVVTAEEADGGADFSPDENGGMAGAGRGLAEVELIDLGDGGELGEGGSEVGAAIQAAVTGRGPEVAVLAGHGAEPAEAVFTPVATTEKLTPPSVEVSRRFAVPSQR